MDLLIQNKLRHKALTILASIGDTVAGKTAAGETYGNVEALLPPPPEPKKILRGPRVYWSRMPELQPVIDLPVGQVAHVVPPAGVPTKKFQSIVCSVACNKFGKGNYTTVLNGAGVDVVRTA